MFVLQGKGLMKTYWLDDKGSHQTSKLSNLWEHSSIS